VAARWPPICTGMRPPLVRTQRLDGEVSALAAALERRPGCCRALRRRRPARQHLAADGCRARGPDQLSRQLVAAASCAALTCGRRGRMREAAHRFLAFSRAFRDCPRPASAFGANLFGAVVGGALENVALMTGYRALLLLASARAATRRACGAYGWGVTLHVTLTFTGRWSFSRQTRPIRHACALRNCATV
jgi:hypothetical protein